MSTSLGGPLKEQNSRIIATSSRKNLLCVSHNKLKQQNLRLSWSVLV